MAASDNEHRWRYDVYLTLPLLRPGATDRLVSCLHRAERRLGVSSGREGERTRLILLMGTSGEEVARSKAETLIAEAVASAGLEQRVASAMEIQQVVRRKALPGGPRSVEAPANGSYQRVALPDGRVLNAAHEGAEGDWIVYLEGEPERGWAGRDLLGVLSELFELPHGTKDDWVYNVIRRLAGRETPLGARYACPCCDCRTLTEPPSGTYVICPVCRWEDDSVQFRDLDYRGGANKPSLRQARVNFRRIGASEARSVDRARPPRLDERP